MSSIHLETVNKVRRAALAVRDLIEECAPRGRLNSVTRKRVAHVSRTAKWLNKALGNMIATDRQLLALLPELAIAAEPTDEELDAIALEHEGRRGDNRAD